MKYIATCFLPLLLSVSLDVRSETPATISIRDFAFSPTAITITVGTTVKWKNLDGEPHTIRGVDADFRSDPLDQNDSFAHTFEKPGTYHYVCSIHPQMTGTVVVKSASSAARSSSSSTPWGSGHTARRAESLMIAR
jgi:plastocyanin